MEEQGQAHPSSCAHKKGQLSQDFALFHKSMIFKILFRVSCLWFINSSALTMILAFTSCCPGGEVKLEVWKCSPEASDQFPRNVHEPGAAQGGTGCPAGFHLPGKQL